MVTRVNKNIQNQRLLMYKYCYIEPIIFTSYLIWHAGRIWNWYVASRFNRIGEIAEVLNSSMTEFFKKNDSVRARPDYLADSINPLPLGKSDMRRNRPSCNGVPNKQMLRTRHHVFEHRNLLPHASRVIETLPQLAPALFELLEGALRRKAWWIPADCADWGFCRGCRCALESTSNGPAELPASAVCLVS